MSETQDGRKVFYARDRDEQGPPPPRYVPRRKRPGSRARLAARSRLTDDEKRWRLYKWHRALRRAIVPHSSASDFQLPTTDDLLGDEHQ